MPVVGVILAGGLGTRLRPLTYTLPKPLLPLFCASLFTDQIQRLSSVTEKIYVLTGYKAVLIKKAVRGLALPVKIVVLEESTPLGTGGALGYYKKEFGKNILLVLNGDVVHRVNFRAYLRAYQEKGKPGMLLAKKVSDVSRYGLLKIDSKGRIRAFLEKQAQRGSGWINGGAYILSPELVASIPEKPCSIEHDCFPFWAREKKLAACCYEGYWQDIGTRESYLQVHFDFLDRRWNFGRKKELCAGFVRIKGKKALVHESCVLEKGVELGPYTVLYPETVLCSEVKIERSVVLSGSCVGEGSIVKDTVVAPCSQVRQKSFLESHIVGQEGESHELPISHFSRV